MSGKPQVFKMGGSWIWQCHHNVERQFGGDFHPEAWRNPWDACLASVEAHAASYHSEVEVIDL